jgi:hypothetical protein
MQLAWRRGSVSCYRALASSSNMLALAARKCSTTRIDDWSVGFGTSDRPKTFRQHDSLPNTTMYMTPLVGNLWNLPAHVPRAARFPSSRAGSTGEVFQSATLVLKVCKKAVQLTAGRHAKSGVFRKTTSLSWSAALGKK